MEALRRSAGTISPEDCPAREPNLSYASGRGRAESVSPKAVECVAMSDDTEHRHDMCVRTRMDWPVLLIRQESPALRKGRAMDDRRTEPRQAVGRPTRLTPERIENMLQAVRAGSPLESAARFAGISRASLYRYLRSSAPEHVAFRSAVSAARATLEVRLSGTIYQEALNDPKWALVWLERFSPAWARPERSLIERRDPSDSTGSAEQPIIVLPADQIPDLVARLLEARRQPRPVRAIEPGESAREPDAP
jgi:transposase